MPIRPNPLGEFPLILREFDVQDPRIGEILLDYIKREMYFVKSPSKEVKSIALDIYEQILNSRTENNKIELLDYDKITPEPEYGVLVPPVEDRLYNAFYYLITSRRETTIEDYNPLNATTWGVRNGITFLGKESGYNPRE